MKVKTKKDYRDRRHLRLRKKIKGTAERPRLCVFKSNAHIEVQCIDDTAGRTIASESTLAAGLKDGPNNREKAREIGRRVAEQLKGQGIAAAVFDSGGFGYEGRVKEIADAAREAGLKI